ncbi:MAG: MATE family efflux transporter [Alphaproteobacteria bacterium]|nr:MATE family efflux transporter [Alphaproteobacteria bacterium]
MTGPNNPKPDRRGVTRDELSALARLGVPLVGASLAEMGMAITDMAIVGRLGALELAAVGLAGGIAFDMLSILLGILTVVGMLVAEAAGAGDHDRVGAIVGQGLRIALGLSVVMVGFALILPWLINLTPQDQGLIPLAAAYLHAVAWAFPLAMVYGVLVDTATALDRTRAVFIVSLGAVIMNAPASWFLVFGFSGFEGLGVAGAGYATSLVHLIMVAALGFWLLRDRALSLTAGNLLSRDKAARGDIVRVGLPVAGMTVIESSMFSITALLMGGFGAAVLAAHRILTGYADGAATIAFAIGDAATMRVARALGAGDMARARHTGQLAIFTGGALLLVPSVLCLVEPRSIAWLFLGDRNQGNAEAYRWMSALSGVAAVYVLASGLQVIAEHALRGLKETLIPMWQSAIGLWGVGLAGGVALAYGLELGAQGLWYGMAAGSGLTALLFVLRFIRLTRPRDSL